jgi:hypothetical protein
MNVIERLFFIINEIATCEFEIGIHTLYIMMGVLVLTLNVTVYRSYLNLKFESELKYDDMLKK